jgi:hypothetical protein
MVRLSPGDWQEYRNDLMSSFRRNFERVVNDKNPPEANDKFTFNSFNDTYLNMELALPRKSGGEVELLKV